MSEFEISEDDATLVVDLAVLEREGIAEWNPETRRWCATEEGLMLIKMAQAEQPYVAKMVRRYAKDERGVLELYRHLLHTGRLAKMLKRYSQGRGMR